MTARTSGLSCAAPVVLLLVTSPPALGLDGIGEKFGNAPISGHPDVADALLPLANDLHRVYLYSVISDRDGGFVCGYFAGDTAAANAFLYRFAALEKGADVVLLPGPRGVTSIDRNRKLSADWELHIPGRAPRRAPGAAAARDGRRGLRALSLVGDTRPTLYLYVRAADCPALSAAPDQIARWLAALDADKFDERERATRELEKQGMAATSALRNALDGKPPMEVRRRIGLLLAKLEGGPGINLGALNIPQGVRVLGPDDLLAFCRQNLKSPDWLERTEVVEVVARMGQDPGALAILTQALSDQKLASQQRAAEILSRLGEAATPALPALRAGLDDPRPYVRDSFRKAIATIEAAKDEAQPAERAKTMNEVREQITRFVKIRTAATKQ